LLSINKAFSIDSASAESINIASRSGDEPRPSLHKYKQNFKLITFPISNEFLASAFLETVVS
jgi:hypothetical protein